MTHPSNDHEDASLLSESSQFQPLPGVAHANDESNRMNTAGALSVYEAIAQGTPAFEQAAQTAAENTAPMTPGGNIDDVGGFSATSTEAYANISEAMRSSFEEIATGMRQLNLKLMEFGRLTAENNFAFVQNVAGIRSVGDAVELQTAYMRGQFDTATSHLQEMQTLTTGIAEKAAAPFKQQFTQATQAFRIG